MKKVVIHSAGGYDKLKIETFPDPRPGKGEVLIETKAIGVNFADCCVRMGVYQSAKEFVGWPITPGFEISGVVKEVGEGVTRFVKGQNVIALTLFGAYSTHVVASEDAVFPLPDALTFEQGAAIPVIFLTAHYALFELAHPKPDQKILVHSAAGGVGSALVQLGRVAKCQVAGVVGSSHKVDYLKLVGAHCIIDKSKEDLWKKAKEFAPKGYNVILDANGVETLKDDYDHLAPGGKLVVYGFHTMFSKGKGTPNWFKMAWDYWRTPKFSPFYMTNENKSIMAFNLSYMFEEKSVLQESMYQILEWLRAGVLQPPAVKTYAFEKVGEAQFALESGNTVGKVVLVV